MSDDLRQKYKEKIRSRTKGRELNNPPPKKKSPYLDVCRVREDGKLIKSCPQCNSEFVSKPDRFGQHRMRYCGAKCYWKSVQTSKSLRDSNRYAAASPSDQFIRSVSRPLYCPEINMSFTSAIKTAKCLGISVRAVYEGLAGKPSSKGLTFVDYDFHKHPMPRHRQPWFTKS